MDPGAAAHAVVAHLAPAAVYVEVGAVLRCLVFQGLERVPDGVPAGTDIPGPGRTVRFQGGVLYAEEGRADAEVTRCADLLGDRMVGFEPAPPPESVARLARAAHRLWATDEADLTRAVVDVAAGVTGAASALLVLTGPAGGLHVAAAVGPRAAAWRKLALRDLQPFIGFVAASRSCTVAEGGYAVAGVHRGGRLTGALVVADRAADDPYAEALELLAEQAGAALDVVALVDDLRDRASRDPLTGLGNVTAFRTALAADPDRPAIVVADIDGFDSVNHLAGHLAGDRLLRGVAAALAAEVRGADRLYRIAGDQFAALLHGVDPGRAVAIGSRLCASTAAVLGEHGTALSAGVAVPVDGEAPPTVLARAEAAVQVAKRTAPGTCVLAATR